MANDEQGYDVLGFGLDSSGDATSSDLALGYTTEGADLVKTAIKASSGSSAIPLAYSQGGCLPEPSGFAGGRLGGNMVRLTTASRGLEAQGYSWAVQVAASG
ncbi:hypothetical protein Dimus_005634 [Dionaea muscipula]